MHWLKETEQEKTGEYFWMALAVLRAAYEFVVYLGSTRFGRRISLHALLRGAIDILCK